MTRLLFLLALSLPLLGERWNVVVAGACCDGCQVRELRLIYLKKQRRIGSCRAVPVNLPFRHAVRTAFMQQVLQVDATQWERYWSTMHFKGIDAPLVLSSPEAVAAFVRNVPGAVGWLPATMTDETMAVLETFEP